MRRIRRRPSRVLVAAGLVLTGCLVLLVFLAAVIGRSPPGWVPTPVQNLAFDVRLVVAPTAKKLVTLTRMPLRGTRVHFDRLGRHTDAAELGLLVPGTLYRPVAADSGPGILLLHGSTPEGRRMGLYRLLGLMLAERGYTVLSIDHGSTGDAAAALRTLDSMDEVHGDLSVMGHSAGAAVALGVGIPNPDVAGIVLMGPAVRVEERAATESAYFQRRELRYRRPPSVQVTDTFPPSRLLESSMDYFSHPDHKPLLLIQGEGEDADDRAFLARLHATMAGPSRLFAVHGADHYMNVLSFGPFVVYDPRVTETLVDGITAWLPGEPTASCGGMGPPCGEFGIPAVLVIAVLATSTGVPVLGLALYFRRPRRAERKPTPPTRPHQVRVVR